MALAESDTHPQHQIINLGKGGFGKGAPAPCTPQKIPGQTTSPPTIIQDVWPAQGAAVFHWAGKLGNLGNAFQEENEKDAQILGEIIEVL